MLHYWKESSVKKQSIHTSVQYSCCYSSSRVIICCSAIVSNVLSGIIIGLPIGYSVIVALTGLPIGYSVIVALTGFPIGYSVIADLHIGYNGLYNSFTIVKRPSIHCRLQAMAAQCQFRETLTR